MKDADGGWRLRTHNLNCSVKSNESVFFQFLDADDVRGWRTRQSQYNGAKITTNTWVTDALELDIDVSRQCYTYLLLCFIVLNL